MQRSRKWVLASEALVLYTSKEGYYFVLLLQVENNPNLSQEVKFKPLHLIFFFFFSCLTFYWFILNSVYAYSIGGFPL